jgi:hypothetical protein
MLRYGSVVVLSAMLLFVVASSLTAHSSSAVTKTPVDVRMDRDDVANVSKSPVSSIAIPLAAQTASSVDTSSHPGLPLRTASKQTLLQKQQYVFRI